MAQANTPTTLAECTALIESRKERAEYYFQNILEGQSDWYSNKAAENKKKHVYFAISVIVLGAVVSLLQVLDTAAWIRYLTALLGASVTIIQALETQLHPGETWQAYRKANEGMKREKRLYLNGADIYAEAKDEQAAYLMLVQRVETVIAEEQKLFWEFQPSNAQTQQNQEQPENP
jgi:hypothetical protein